MPIHSAMTDSDGIHQPKGISVASDNETYVANGAGGGTWKEPEPKGIASETSGKAYISDGAGSGSWEAIPLEDLPFIEVVNEGDDKGIIITEQFSVGTPGDPKESCHGGGDSYGVGLEDGLPGGTPVAGSAWHCTIANTSGMTITSATDITTTLASDTGSTTGLFNGTVVGNYLLVGSEYPYGGAKVKINTLATVEPGNIVGEYLSSVGTWTTSTYMVTDAEFPYEQKGSAIATCSSCAEQWRFGFNPLILPVPWDKVTLNINGTNYTKYWARFRITSSITSDPVIEQIKLHTNRFEINADGTTEYFGRARYERTIPFEITTNALKNPANENITVGVGITEVRTDNEFADSSSDGVIITGVVPTGFDSSVPLQVVIDWYPVGTGTGDVELELETINAPVGFTYDGTAVPNAATPVVTSINNQNLELQRTTFLLSGFTVLPGDKIYGSLFRDATPSNTEDTFAASIIITGVQVIGYFWRP